MRSVPTSCPRPTASRHGWASGATTSAPEPRSSWVAGACVAPSCGPVGVLSSPACLFSSSEPWPCSVPHCSRSGWRHAAAARYPAHSRGKNMNRADDREPAVRRHGRRTEEDLRDRAFQRARETAERRQGRLRAGDQKSDRRGGQLRGEREVRPRQRHRRAAHGDRERHEHPPG